MFSRVIVTSRKIENGVFRHFPVFNTHKIEATHCFMENAVCIPFCFCRMFVRISVHHGSWASFFVRKPAMMLLAAELKRVTHYICRPFMVLTDGCLLTERINELLAIQ